MTRIFEAEAATSHLIIEQKIEEVHNYCVQFSLFFRVRYPVFRTAQQLTNKYGFYAGNENVHDIPQQVINAGYEIMEIGVKQGFFGVAGFDLLLDQHGDVFCD